ARRRANFCLIGSGQGVHWPDLDDDISVEGMLHGILAHRPRARSVRANAGRLRSQRPRARRVQSARRKRPARALVLRLIK
ncbi:MAG: DUF2442 domain-containing protein, partial [Betaproteobacteria bacterium]